MPWGRPHEGIPVLWETTFFFQRAKPIVVSPFENPFPTRGRGPWTPKGGSGQSLVSSHTIYRPRPTDRQLLGVGRLLASYNVLRIAQGCALVVTPESRRPTLSVIPTEPAGRLEGSPTRNRCRLGGKGLALAQTTRRNFCPLRNNLRLSKGETNRGFTL